MTQFGLVVHSALVTDLKYDQGVLDAMNEVQTAKRDLEATINRSSIRVRGLGIRVFWGSIVLCFSPPQTSIAIVIYGLLQEAYNFTMSSDKYHNQGCSFEIDYGEEGGSGGRG